MLLSSKLIYANMNVDMSNSDVDVQSSMLRYNFDFWRRWNAIGKFRFQNVFIFKFHQFKECFVKLRFRDGLVWTVGQTVQIKDSMCGGGGGGC